MPKVNVYNNTIAAMNSRLDMVLWDSSDDTNFQAVFTAINTVVNQIELTLSMYNTNSETFRLNSAATGTNLLVSDLLFDTLSECIKYYRKTEGYFNIGYGNTASNNLCDQVALHPEKKQIEILLDGVKLDFGGIGKGIALRHISTVLKTNNIKNAFISFGGSSILTRGRHPYGDYWPFAIEDGQNTSLKLNNAAVSISGYHQNDKREHVCNPFTGEVKHQSTQVEVQMQCPVEAEVLSTALLVAPQKEHQSIIQAFNPDYCKCIK